jgi:hypothetical protein
MKTARITLFAERHPSFDVRFQNDIGTAYDYASIVIAHGIVIGEPKIELDEHHRCSLSAAQLLAGMRGMRDYGGGFARRLADLLEVADGGNTEKLLDTFHDVIWNYVPMGEVAR